MSSFDGVAPYYDFLARLVFGKSIVDAQEYFLSEIKEGDRILILGGGTGWILETIFKMTSPKEIWYVDSSQKMIDKSSRRNMDSSKVHFICGTNETIPSHIKFDVIITNFFLDMFSPEQLDNLIENLKGRMDQNAIWISTDFIHTGKWYHEALLRVMYTFFKTMTNLTNSALPDWKLQLTKAALRKKNERTFWNGFISTTVFCKG